METEGNLRCYKDLTLVDQLPQPLQPDQVVLVRKKRKGKAIFSSATRLGLELAHGWS